MNKHKSREETSSYLFLAPYIILFVIFILVPVLYSLYLSFTNFNTVQDPTFTGLKNYIRLFTEDTVFMQYAFPNTVKFALIVGPVGYGLSFIMAWMLAQIPHKPRTIFALMLYSPSMTSGVVMAVLWKVIFSGDANGYINAILLSNSLITEPIPFLTSPKYLMTVMIGITIWNSMGVGFLAMLAGVLNVNQELYEAAYIDGMKSRFQEIFFVTIPSMKPQMLFGAVMAVVSTFQAGVIGVDLSGTNPTPQNAGQLIVNHIDDFGFMRFEMGYASAISVFLILFIYVFSKVAKNLFAED